MSCHLIHQTLWESLGRFVECQKGQRMFDEHCCNNACKTQWDLHVKIESGKLIIHCYKNVWFVSTVMNKIICITFSYHSGKVFAQSLGACCPERIITLLCQKNWKKSIEKIETFIRVYITHKRRFIAIGLPITENVAIFHFMAVKLQRRDREQASLHHRPASSWRCQVVTVWYAYNIQLLASNRYEFIVK